MKAVLNFPNYSILAIMFIFTTAAIIVRNFGLLDAILLKRSLTTCIYSVLHFSAAQIRRLIKQGRKDAETTLTQQKKN